MGKLTKIFPIFCIFAFACVLNICLGVEEDTELDSENSNLTSIEIIRYYGYPVEVHKVQTEDGYILELHRIPHGKNSSSDRGVPILLVHGLLASSVEFLLIESDSLAFVLADAGYDVWMLNFRGSTYSNAHTSLRPNDTKFWDFSWHENGYYDIPSSIDYVCKHTKRDQILYMGYSMGTTAFFVMASMRPEYQEKLQGAIMLGPTAYVKHTKTPLRLLAPFSKTIKGLHDIFGKGGMLEQTPELQNFVKVLCTPKLFCRNFLFLVAGRNSRKYHTDLLPKALMHIPAGTSVKTATHYAQLVLSGKFRQYDYGTLSNLRRYNQTKPPEYNLEVITLPIVFFVAPNDYFATKRDLEHLLQRMNTVKNIHIIPSAKFTHLDFVFGKDLRELLYPTLLKELEYTMTQGTASKPVKKQFKDQQNTAVPKGNHNKDQHNKIQNTRVKQDKVSYNQSDQITVNHNAVDRNTAVYNEPKYNPNYQIKYIYDIEYKPADFNTLNQNEIIYNEAEQNNYSEADYNLIDQNIAGYNDGQAVQNEVVYNEDQYSQAIDQNKVVYNADYNPTAYSTVNQNEIIYNKGDYNSIDQNKVVYNEVNPYKFIYGNGQYNQANQNEVVYGGNQYGQAIDQNKLVYNDNYNPAAYNSFNQNEIVYNEVNPDTVVYNDGQYNQAVQNEVVYNEDQYIDQNKVVYNADYNSDAYNSDSENEIVYNEEDEDETLYKVKYVPVKYKKVSYYPLNYKNVDYSGAQYSDF